jgi:hypothetical protein
MRRSRCFCEYQAADLSARTYDALPGLSPSDSNASLRFSVAALAFIYDTVYDAVNRRYRLFWEKVMGRPPLGNKATQVRLPEEDREQILKLVGEKGMAQFIREAVKRELKRRAKQGDQR